MPWGLAIILSRRRRDSSAHRRTLEQTPRSRSVGRYSTWRTPSKLLPATPSGLSSVFKRDWVTGAIRTTRANAAAAVPRQAPDHLAATHRLADQRDLAKIKLFDQSREIVGQSIEVVAATKANRPAMAAPVKSMYRNRRLAKNAILGSPSVRVQGPRG